MARLDEQTETGQVSRTYSRPSILTFAPYDCKPAVKQLRCASLNGFSGAVTAVEKQWENADAELLPERKSNSAPSLLYL